MHTYIDRGIYAVPLSHTNLTINYQAKTLEVAPKGW